MLWRIYLRYFKTSVYLERAIIMLSEASCLRHYLQFVIALLEFKYPGQNISGQLFALDWGFGYLLKKKKRNKKNQTF